MTLSLVYYLIGSVGVFLQHNLQFIHPFWKGKDVLSVLVFSLPVGYCYLKSWTYFVETSGSAWTARFMFFALSYLVFPVLTYVFMNETPFTAKTLICIILSILMILVQYKL